MIKLPVVVMLAHEWWASVGGTEGGKNLNPRAWRPEEGTVVSAGTEWSPSPCVVSQLGSGAPAAAASAVQRLFFPCELLGCPQESAASWEGARFPSTHLGYLLDLAGPRMPPSLPSLPPGLPWE